MRRTAGRRIKRELMKILDVLTGLSKPPGTCTGSSVLFLATFIPFAAERCPLAVVCLSVQSSSVHPEVGMAGRWGARRGNIRVGLDLPEQTDLSAYLDILSLKSLCRQLSPD